MSYTLENANSVLTVDLSKVQRNIERIRAHIGPDVDIMYTAKSNGYGHGLIEPTLYMRDHCNIHCFATGQLCEAIELREAGLQDFILVMGGIPYSGVPSAVENDLVTTVYEETLPRLLIYEAARLVKTAGVHIMVATGRRRLGARPGEQLAQLIQTLQSLPYLQIDGVYTHLANGYSLDKSFTHQQMGEFAQALAQLKDAGIRPRLIHAANTAACVASPECYFDAVRLAALIFGYDISPGVQNRLGLEPSMRWTSKILNVLWADEGENVSYYRFFVPKRRTKIAIIGFGMGDGYVRNLVTRDTEHNADVLVHGKRARLLDLNVDVAFADVTDIPDVKIGDTAVLIGKDGDDEITSMELGERGGTSNGHVCCSITSRPLRRYVTD